MTENAASFAFSLIDHDGRSVCEADYCEKYVIVVFGFTNCESVCPRHLKRLTDALNRLGHNAGRINPLYISVDPERDNPEALKA